MSGTRLGMVRCEHCGRQFNPHSAARHIPWCEKQKQERNKHRLSNEKRQALERYKWRISYRPSNHLHQNNQQQHHNQAKLRRQSSSELANNKLKKSSVNSSATLSSPSASSSASLSTNSANDTSYHLQRQQRRRPAARRQESPQLSTSQLQRSISSLTLTKRQGLARIPEPEASSHRVGGNLDAQTRMRTKSTNDLSNMGEMVETLARRVEEIYAQNQLLLASFPKGSAAHVLVGRPGRTTTPELDDSDECDNGLGTVKCHHCKADCRDEANYCHKCGCKVRVTSPSSPT